MDVIKCKIIFVFMINNLTKQKAALDNKTALKPITHDKIILFTKINEKQIKL